MNDKYISVNKFKEMLANLDVKGFTPAVKKGIEIALRDAVPQLLDDEPAADVQPVKHGRWEETHISLCKWIPGDEKEEGHSFYMAELKCSCCKRYNAVTFVLTLDKPEFCQFCGARMEGAKNE